MLRKFHLQKWQPFIKMGTSAIFSLLCAGLTRWKNVQLASLWHIQNKVFIENFDENGGDLSGGEAQKIALARVFYKNASFIILDEPTAALEPIAEFEVYNGMNQMIEERSAVFISHRLSSCRFCQDIAVFHEGRLVQRGSHDVLVSDKSGIYYNLWNAQAQYYEVKD